MSAESPPPTYQAETQDLIEQALALLGEPRSRYQGLRRTKLKQAAYWIGRDAS